MFLRGKQRRHKCRLFLHFALVQASHIAGYRFNFLVTETKSGGAHDFCVTIIGAAGRSLRIPCDRRAIDLRRTARAGPPAPESRQAHCPDQWVNGRPYRQPHYARRRRCDRSWHPAPIVQGRSDHLSAPGRQNRRQYPPDPDLTLPSSCPTIVGTTRIPSRISRNCLSRYFSPCPASLGKGAALLPSAPWQAPQATLLLFPAAASPMGLLSAAKLPDAQPSVRPNKIATLFMLIPDKSWEGMCSLRRRCHELNQRRVVCIGATSTHTCGWHCIKALFHRLQ